MAGPTRQGRRARLGVALVLSCAAPAPAQERAAASFYGMPGLIDMPTAESYRNGDLALTTSYTDGIRRNTLAFQITPGLIGSFRYSIIDEFDGRLTRYDRSFDLAFRLWDEGDRRPAVAVGLQDFGGTGIYAGEYVVATKQLPGGITGSVGLGWGRFGSFGEFDNPLGGLADRFDTRPEGPQDINEVGRVEFDQWFRGDAAVFGGVSWQATDRLSVVAEYSSDGYDTEVGKGLIDRDSPLNFGLRYRTPVGLDLGLYSLYGSQVGLTASYIRNAGDPVVPGGREEAPRPVLTRAALAASESWAGRVRESPRAALAREGVTALSVDREAETLAVTIENDRYGQAAQAVGRTARVLSRTTDPAVETFAITLAERGVPVSTVRIARADLEALEFAPDGAWQSYARARIADGAGAEPPRRAEVAALYPRTDADARLYVAPGVFDPDDPVRADLGLELSGTLAPRPGLAFSGAVRKRLAGNRDEITRESNSELPRVRSDVAEYDRQADPEVTYLTGDYFFRPGTDLYGRISAGLFERMYGGLATEVLWKPVTGPLAFGGEIARVRQRAFDGGFDFQDYEVTTGHLSAYYAFDGGFHGQVDVGRYLAGDWGATFALDRAFDNGVRVGAFFTLTDVPFEEFGEGSFDKGIRIDLPISWLTGTPTREDFSTTIRPVLRDGGARLEMRDRLYGLTRDNHDPALRAGWGRFWR